MRSDIRSSFGRTDRTADGVPLTIELTLVSATTCAPLAGRAVYLWHCDRTGRYSLYSSGVTNQNYLRGVQEADANGAVSFTSIFPGLLLGPLAAHPLRGVSEPGGGDDVANKIATSQLALPQAACDRLRHRRSTRPSVDEPSRSRSRRTTSSATAHRWSSRRSRARRYSG